MAGLSRRWIGLGLLALAACQSLAEPPPDPAPDLAISFDRAALAAIRLKAVLVAGDAAQPVFDNATSYLHDRLVAAGLQDRDIHRLSAAARPRGGAAEATSLGAVTDRIGSLKAEAGEGCF